ncbi:MAG: gliding motility protein GldL [Paludibacter sp.]
MSTEDSKFDLWWSSPETKRVVGAAYSLGAAVVIIGAMFKILHLPGAAVMLGLGMSVEAVLFSLGILDKPHKDYEWDKVYDFDGLGEKQTVTGSTSKSATEVTSGRSVGLNYTKTISDDDVKKLSEGIKNLTSTADQFASLSNVVGSTDKFVKNIDAASLATGKFVQNQETLNEASGLLTTSYQGINDKIELVEKSTKQYAIKVEDINKNLSSINSIYEIQLKNIQAQSEGLTQQTEQVRLVSKELYQILGDTEKMKASTLLAAEAADIYKTNSLKLAKQVADLNHVYGNMLNALN